MAEAYVHPDEYQDMTEGEYNSSSDAVRDDFVYQEIEGPDGQVRRIRKPVLEAQTAPPEYPENLADPTKSPEEMDVSEHEEKELTDKKKEEEEKILKENQNGVYVHDEDKLPPLQQKIDEAQEILDSRSHDEENSRSKSRHRGRGSERE